MIELKNLGAENFVPDNIPVKQAISRTTHMAIAAHQDDVEFMAYDGIRQCFGKRDEWFYAVVVTDGAGSPRKGMYESFTDEQMREIRKKEQKKAAYIGEYGALSQLDYTSSTVKDPQKRGLVDELVLLITLAKPDIIYTHNLADKHDTHVSVAVKVIKALREVPQNIRPQKVYGCEVWRNLDWLNDDEKVLFDVGGHANLAAALNEVFDSQVCGGKRYDLAVAGRRLANATFFESHSTDISSALIYGMDLTPLIDDTQMDIFDYVQGYINRFANDVKERIHRLL